MASRLSTDLESVARHKGTASGGQHPPGQSWPTNLGAPWYVVDANIKRHARLNVIRHLLDQVDYQTIERPVVEFPPRPDKGD